MSKISRSVQLALGERLLPVGKLVFESDGRRQASMFRYDIDWLEHPRRFALCPSMPLSEAPYIASGSRENKRAALHHPIADAAPDSWGRGIISKSIGGSPTEMDFLLAADDRTRQGAIRFLDENGKPLADAEPPIPRLNDLSNLRELARSYELDPEAARQAADRLIGFAGSLGGARPKSNFDDDGVLAIAKFTSALDTMPIERVEVATLQLAARAGIRIPDVRLELADTDRPVAIIRRFDRRNGARVPYISGQTLTDIDAREGGYYTDIADALRAVAHEPHRQLVELYRRMVFTILVSNNDDHLKNHGFLYVGDGKWTTAPAFDINPQPERHRHLETGISELSGNEASIEAAIEAAPFFDVDLDESILILEQVLTAIENGWKPLLLEAGLSERQAKQYAPAFENEETLVARSILARHQGNQPRNK